MDDIPSEEGPLNLPFDAVKDFRIAMMSDLDNLMNSSLDCSLEDDREVESISVADENTSDNPIIKTTSVICRTRSRSRNKSKSPCEEDIVEIDSGKVYNTRSKSRRRQNSTKNKRKKVTLQEVLVVDDDDDDVSEVPIFIDLSKKNDYLKVDDDDTVNVKVNWFLDGYSMYKLKYREPFSKVYELASKEKGVSKECITIEKNDTRVTYLDTPETINLSVIDILAGRINRQPVDINQPKNTQKSENMLEVKVITDGKRQNEFHFTIGKDQQMSVLFFKVAVELKCSKEDLILSFDGDIVKPTDTAADLDLEGGECFEVRLKINK